MVNGALYLFRPSILYIYITGESPSNTTTSDLLAEDTTLSTVDFRKQQLGLPERVRWPLVSLAVTGSN